MVVQCAYSGTVLARGENHIGAIPYCYCSPLAIGLLVARQEAWDCGELSHAVVIEVNNSTPYMVRL